MNHPRSGLYLDECHPKGREVVVHWIFWLFVSVGIWVLILVAVVALARVIWRLG